jgi:hypothetical protein
MNAWVYKRKFLLGSESADSTSELQEQCRDQFSEENFEPYESNPETVLSSIITVDERWVHHLYSETKQ